MNSSIFVEINNPLEEVYRRVYGERPRGLSQIEIAKRTVEVIGSPGWGIDKKLAREYFAEVVKTEHIHEISDMVLDSAEASLGHKFGSVEELGFLLTYGGI